MPSISFNAVRESVMQKLGELDPRLTYHSPEHTLDVLQQAERIAIEENVTDPAEIFLLKIASLYHDTGFLETYNNHEERSAGIFLSDAGKIGLGEKEIKIVVNLIMSTKIPQQPSTLLEKIICDADLDYLGREDFFEIGENLRKEFLQFSIIKNDDEWNNLQLKFLRHHHYHTLSSQKQREPFKQMHLQEIASSFNH